MRTVSFIAGLVLAGAATLAAAPDRPRRNPALKGEACARDHVHNCAQFEADHIIPLFFEHYFRVNLDILSNIQLQPWPEARRKDEVELEVYRAISSGRMTPAAGWSVFANHRGGW